MKKSLRAAGISMSAWAWTAAAIVGGGVMLVGCVQEPAPFDPLRMQQWERSNDAQIKAKPMYPLPTTQESRYVPGETEPRPMQVGDVPNVPEGKPALLSLQEIIHRSVLNSLDIRVAGYDTAVDQTRVMEAEGHFDPTFFAGGQFERVDKSSAFVDATIPNPSAATTGQPFTSQTVTFDKEAITTAQMGIRRNSESGGQIELKQQVVNSWFDPARSVVNPFYETDLVLTITQPLLQNFGVEVNRARITIAQNNQRVSLLDFRKTTEDTVLQIEKSYWQLVQAEQDVQTLERLVKASEQTTDVLFRRQQTDVSAVQIQQSNAATDTRRAQLIRARARLGDLSDQLKALMYDPEFPVAGAVLITPTDLGTDAALRFNLDEQIEAGLENRLELGQQQVRISSAEIALKVAKNNLLPALNFQGTVTVDGVDTRLVRNNDLGQALAQEGNFNHIGFVAGLQLEIPLGNRAARAIWQRALLQRQQAIDSYGGLITKVIEDVKTAAREVDTSWNELKTTRNARFANEKTLLDLQQQQEAGNVPFTPETVQLRLDYQERLAAAEQAEHQAMFNYNFAIANLEKTKGTILRYNNVLLEEQQVPFVDKSQGTNGVFGY